MSVAAALIPALLGGPSVALAAPDRVALESREIRISDVADLRGLDVAERRRLGARVIARLPAGAAKTLLSRAAVAGLVRRTVPGLVVSAGEGEITFELPAAPLRSPGCVALSRPLAEGQTVAPPDVEPAECGDAAGAVRFDRRTGAVRAAAPLAAGTKLGALRVEAAPAVAAGASLTLVSRAGPVAIARDVVALQPGRAGGRVFVRDADGTIISAPVAESEEPK